MGRTSAVAKQRQQAKRGLRCPHCMAPPGRRCANLTKTRGWWPEIPRSQETKHIHPQRLQAWETRP